MDKINWAAAPTSCTSWRNEKEVVSYRRRRLGAGHLHFAAVAPQGEALAASEVEAHGHAGSSARGGQRITSESSWVQV